MGLALLLVAYFLIGGVGTTAMEKPESSAEGAFIFTVGGFFWPLLLIGWLVSRPWVK